VNVFSDQVATDSILPTRPVRIQRQESGLAQKLANQGGVDPFRQPIPKSVFSAAAKEAGNTAAATVLQRASKTNEAKVAGKSEESLYKELYSAFFELFWFFLYRSKEQDAKKLQGSFEYLYSHLKLSPGYVLAMCNGKKFNINTLTMTVATNIYGPQKIFQSRQSYLGESVRTGEIARRACENVLNQGLGPYEEGVVDDFRGRLLNEQWTIEDWKAPEPETQGLDWEAPEPETQGIPETN
jgi:hypothetical protein